MKEQRNGLLLVVSGPSGVGKGTLVKALMDRNSRIKMSVSATTRAPRPGEVEGVHYFFKTEEEFKAMVDRGEFLEYMHVFGSNYYGTPRSFVEKTLKTQSVILEIDVVGALNVKKEFPETVLVMVVPPTLEELKRRLAGRGSETEAQIENRLARMEYELSYKDQYDYIIVNDDLERAIAELCKIIDGE